MNGGDKVHNELQEILSRLEALRVATSGEKTPVIPLIDPTANVLRLVKAAMERQDDLRKAENRRIDELRKKSEECAHEVSAVQLLAQKDLAGAEQNRINAITLAESRRIDALLAAMQAAVALASEKAAAQAAALATQVVASAEALRTQVAATAAATSTQIATLGDTLGKRLQVVEQNQYQQGGAKTEGAELRSRSQWSIGLVITTGIALVLLLMRLLGK